MSLAASNGTHADLEGSRATDFACDKKAATPRPSDRCVQIWERYAKAGAGDESEDDLVKAYLPLVKTAAGRLGMHLPSHVDERELYSAGLVGLLEALRHFDGKRNFESYARIRIRGAMLDELRRLDWAPRSVHAKARKVQEAIAELEQRHGRFPEDIEVAEALGLGPKDYGELMEEIRPATFVCLDSCEAGAGGHHPHGYNAGGDESAMRGGKHETLADSDFGAGQRADEAAARSDLSHVIAQGMERLPEFQRKVLALYYYEGLRVHEIAAATGFSRAHVCQTHAKAILAIRGFVERYERKGASALSSRELPRGTDPGEDKS